jgi:hypothetical protein
MAVEPTNNPAKGVEESVGRMSLEICAVGHSPLTGYSDILALTAYLRTLHNRKDALASTF